MCVCGAVPSLGAEYVLSNSNNSYVNTTSSGACKHMALYGTSSFDR